MTERVQKILSEYGIASRRHAEKLILEGRVRVNGKIATLGQKANLKKDRLEVDGKAIKPQQRPQLLYILLNKPPGVVCSCSDPKKRTTVLDLLPQEISQGQGLHPVGRLDAESSGALLLTNDGQLTLRLTHPRYHLPKTYQVWVRGDPPETVLENWRTGVMLDGQKTLPAQIRVLTKRQEKTLLEIVLTEGKNRQIRKIGELLGYNVIKLHRSAIGLIKLQPPYEQMLPSGQYRFLTSSELNFLKKQTNLTKTG